MADKWDELTQLEVAFDALKTMDREGQIRSIQWLNDRLADDYQKAIAERDASARARIADRSAKTTVNTDGGDHGI